MLSKFRININTQSHIHFQAQSLDECAQLKNKYHYIYASLERAIEAFTRYSKKL